MRWAYFWPTHTAAILQGLHALANKVLPDLTGGVPAMIAALTRIQLHMYLGTSFLLTLVA